jgi:hypothetical protein
MYLMSHYFLWTYPHNEQLLQVHFFPIADNEEDTDDEDNSSDEADWYENFGG